jgi:hypothetical protein
MEWNSNFGRSRIRRKVFESDLLEYRCDECGIESWHGKQLTLHLDHINGKNNDHRIENLRWLCPNCHSLTPTYCGKNHKSYSIVNPKVSDDELLEAMKKTSSPARALHSLGLAGAGNYPRVYRLAKKHNIEHQMSKEDLNTLRIERLNKANIDTSKFGWVQKASEVIGITPQKTRSWIQKNYPSYLEYAYKR